MSIKQGIIDCLGECTREVLGKRFRDCDENKEKGLFLELAARLNEISIDGVFACSKEIVTPYGTAISSREASLCMGDSVRTRAFWRGLVQAVRAAMERFPDEKIRVLYAGTGPFGTLFLPLTQAFEPDDLELTALEINALSLTNFRKIVETLGFEEFIGRYVLTDASSYSCEKAPHIVVCETMDKALTCEPQAAITTNLAPQLAVGGVLVPEEVRVLVDIYSLNTSTQARVLGTLYNLNKSSRSESGHIEVRGEFELPVTELSGSYRPRLCTFIKVFDNEIVATGESLITNPLFLQSFVAGEEAPKKMRVSYTLGGPRGKIVYEAIRR